MVWTQYGNILAHISLLGYLLFIMQCNGPRCLIHKLNVYMSHIYRLFRKGNMPELASFLSDSCKKICLSQKRV